VSDVWSCFRLGFLCTYFCVLCLGVGVWHGLDVAVKRVVFQALGQQQQAEERRQQVGAHDDIIAESLTWLLVIHVRSVLVGFLLKVEGGSRAIPDSTKARMLTTRRF
jgi:hypothetical protein